MVEIDALWLTLLINACAVSCVVLVCWVGLTWWRNRRDYRSMRILAKRVREGALARKEELRGYIAESCRLPEAQAEAHAVQINQAERQLAKSFIGVYVRRDARAAEGFDHWVDELASQYRLLGPAVVSVVEQPASKGDDAPVELAESQAECVALRSQLGELKHKLGISYETIDRMLKEYSQMFSGSVDGAEVGRDAMMQLVTGTGESAPQDDDEKAEKLDDGEQAVSG